MPQDDTVGVEQLLETVQKQLVKDPRELDILLVCPVQLSGVSDTNLLSLRCLHRWTYDRFR